MKRILANTRGITIISLLSLVCSATTCPKSDYKFSWASAEVNGEYFYGEQKGLYGGGHIGLEHYNGSSHIVICTPVMDSSSSESESRFFIKVIEPSIIEEPIIGKRYEFKKGYKISYCDDNGLFSDSQAFNSFDNTIVDDFWVQRREDMEVTVLDGWCEFGKSSDTGSLYFSIKFCATLEDNEGNIMTVLDGICFCSRAYNCTFHHSTASNTSNNQ